MKDRSYLYVLYTCTSGLYTSMIMLNLYKALDTVDHEMLKK